MCVCVRVCVCVCVCVHAIFKDLFTCLEGGYCMQGLIIVPEANPHIAMECIRF